MQEKYEQSICSLAQMEKRAVMAESMLEATLQYDSGQVKAQAMPAYAHFFIFYFWISNMIDFHVINNAIL